LLAITEIKLSHVAAFGGKKINIFRSVVNGIMALYKFCIIIKIHQVVKNIIVQQCWSPREQGLVLENPWGQFWNPWSWRLGLEARVLDSVTGVQWHYVTSCFLQLTSVFTATSFAKIEDSADV